MVNDILSFTNSEDEEKEMVVIHVLSYEDEDYEALSPVTISEDGEDYELALGKDGVPELFFRKISYENVTDPKLCQILVDMMNAMMEAGEEEA